ncbi:MAG: NAD-dependent epimerase/dehydratase family protein [Bacteroidetes bacterium]|nr:NAD-dependent epimerase/dehydratase family protein [Bacteroidota bacterium]
MVAFFMAYILRFNFQLSSEEVLQALKLAPLVLSIRLVSFYLTKTYSGIVRYTGTQDAVRIFIALTSGTIFIILCNLINYIASDEVMIPSSIIIIDYLISMTAMTSSRLAYKILFQQIRSESPKKTNVIIYGAGQSGMITKRTLDQDNKINYKVIAFVDDSDEKAGKRIDGVPIFSGDELNAVIEKSKVDELIISIQNIAKHRKREIIETCISYDIKVKNVPPVERWINGELNYRQIKKVNIEDLLERDPIELDKVAMSQSVRGKVILVTGAAGSIGSEITRQILSFYPKKVILLDQAETPLYELEKELFDHFKHNKEILAAFEICVGDIKNVSKLRRIFENNKPNVVFHAAAYKHVPLMELNPSAAVATNVFGTKILADTAVEYGTERFVMVSTDKAVNPTNVMGASKRVAEIYVQSLNFSHVNKETKFITTRFGNVLGSNGSVIPYFRKQISEGGPITVTHPEITRYFMTIPEACQLVIEAGNMGDGGEIFLFDMGLPVKIVELAKKMIKLSGLTLGKDIQIEYIGLRPGEKIAEELLSDSENTLPTHHPKITRAKIKPFEYTVVSEIINELISLLAQEDNEEIVRKMKQIVPEFISNNSIYEALDGLKIN